MMSSVYELFPSAQLGWVSFAFLFSWVFHSRYIYNVWMDASKDDVIALDDKHNTSGRHR